MPKRIAIIGDVHGCIAELTELLDRLQSESLDAIYHLGDLVDRGPDSGAVVTLMRSRGIAGVMGNHESKVLDLLTKSKASAIKDDDKRRTALSLEREAGALEYLSALPRLHVIEDVCPETLLLVHGGLWPGLPLWKQPFAVLMAQRIDPHKPGAVAWLSDAKAEAAGMIPWWEVWDGPEIAVFGHTVFPKPQIVGRTIGIDTGCVFGGALTALILPDRRFIQVPAKARYAERDGFYGTEEDLQDHGR